MSLMYSQMVPLGAPCPDFSLPGIDGKTHTPAALINDKKALVVIVMCNHCPYVQAQWERLVALDEDFVARGIQFVGINPNDAESYPEDSFEKMKQYAERYGMKFPYLCDESQSVARVLGAVCTPDIFVYDHALQLVYRGRLDDNWEHPDRVMSHDLRDALDRIARGEVPVADQKPSQGCSIKWKK